MSAGTPPPTPQGSSGLTQTRKEPRFSRWERRAIAIGAVLLAVTFVVDALVFPRQQIGTNATIFGSEAEAWVALALLVEGWFSYQNWLRNRSTPHGTTGPPTTPPPPPQSDVGSPPASR